MFRSSSGQTGGVQEDAIMTVGVLVEGLCMCVIMWLGHVIILHVLVLFAAIEGEFLRYMEVFKPYLVIALKNHAEYQVHVDHNKICIRTHPQM